MLRRTVDLACGRQTRSFSVMKDSEKKLLKKLLSRGDASAVETHLREIWMKQQGPTGNLSTQNSHGKKNVSNIISSLCITRSSKVTDVKLAFSLLAKVTKLSKQPSTALFAGYLGVLDHCLQSNRLEDAMVTFGRIRSLGRVLDTDSANRLVLQLSENCRLYEIREVMDNLTITDTMLIACAEPFIMSGLVKTFNGYMTRYINNLQLPGSQTVADIINAVVVARIRRSNSLIHFTRQEEYAVSTLFLLLEEYHKKLLQEYLREGVGGEENAEPQLTSLYPSYGATILLSDTEQSIYKSRSKFNISRTCYHGFTEPVEIFETEGRSLNGQAAFRYLMEDLVSSDSKTPMVPPASRGLKIKDLTLEMARQQSPLSLLYDASIFPGAYQYEVSAVKDLLTEKNDTSLQSGFDLSAIGGIGVMFGMIEGVGIIVSAPEPSIHDADSDYFEENEEPSGMDVMDAEYDDEDFDLDESDCMSEFDEEDEEEDIYDHMYHYDQQVEIEVDPRLKSFLTYCYKLGNNTSASPSPLPTTQSTSKSIGRKTAPTNFVYQGSGFDDSDDCDSDRDLVAELGDRSDSDSNISCSRSSNSSNSICRSNSNDNSNENSSSGGSHCAGSGIRVDDMTTALCGRDPNYKMEFSSSIFQAVREMSPFFDYGDPNIMLDYKETQKMWLQNHLENRAVLVAEKAEVSPLEDRNKDEDEDEDRGAARKSSRGSTDGWGRGPESDSPSQFHPYSRNSVRSPFDAYLQVTNKRRRSVRGSRVGTPMNPASRTTHKVTNEDSLPQQKDLDNDDRE